MVNNKKRGRKALTFAGAALLSLIFILQTAPAFGAESAGYTEREVMTIEYRYTEGDDLPVIEESINQFGIIYHLVSKSEPVLESSLPVKRTYTYKLSGNISASDLAQIAGIENITLTPHYEVLTRDYVTTEKVDVPVNDAEYIAETKTFTVPDATRPNNYSVMELTRAGIEFEELGKDEDGLPGSYRATVYYRGVENYYEVVYYTAETAYVREETEGDVDSFIITAKYESDIVTEEEPEEPLDPEPVTEPIEKEEASFAEGAEGEGVPLLNILGNKVPFTTYRGLPAWALADLLFVLITIVIALTSVIQQAVKKAFYGKTMTGVLSAAACAVAGIVLFLLLQNTQEPLVIIDKYTPVHLALFAGAVIASAKANHYQKFGGQ